MSYCVSIVPTGDSPQFNLLYHLLKLAVVEMETKWELSNSVILISSHYLYFFKGVPPQIMSILLV